MFAQSPLKETRLLVIVWVDLLSMGKPVEVALHVLVHLSLHLVLLVDAPARRLRPLLGELAGEDAEDQVHHKEGSKDHLGDKGYVGLVLGVPKKSCEQNFEAYVERPEFWPRVAQTPIIKAVKILLATSFLGHPVRKMFGRIKWIDQEDEREGGGYCREMVMADEAILPGEEGRQDGSRFQKNIIGRE